jgi:iron-sulfur cluster assembly protein CyaY
VTEQEFRLEADRALDDARRSLLPLADRAGFEVELGQGVLAVVFEEPVDTKFVVSPNAPVRQIWVSAMAKSYKLAWVPDRQAFALDGEPLAALLERLANAFLSLG